MIPMGVMKDGNISAFNYETYSVWGGAGRIGQLLLTKVAVAKNVSILKYSRVVFRHLRNMRSRVIIVVRDNLC